MPPMRLPDAIQSIGIFREPSASPEVLAAVAWTPFLVVFLLLLLLAGRLYVSWRKRTRGTVAPPALSNINSTMGMTYRVHINTPSSAAGASTPGGGGGGTGLGMTTESETWRPPIPTARTLSHEGTHERVEAEASPPPRVVPKPTNSGKKLWSAADSPTWDRPLVTDHNKRPPPMLPDGLKQPSWRAPPPPPGSETGESKRDGDN